MTQNDLKILSSIVNKDNKIGINKCNGATKKLIREKTELSKTKIDMTIKMLLSENYIEKALKVRNQDSFIITTKGLKLILEMNGKLEEA